MVETEQDSITIAGAEFEIELDGPQGLPQESAYSEEPEAPGSPDTRPELFEDLYRDAPIRIDMSQSKGVAVLPESPGVQLEGQLPGSLFGRFLRSLPTDKGPPKWMIRFFSSKDRREFFRGIFKIPRLVGGVLGAIGIRVGWDYLTNWAAEQSRTGILKKGWKEDLSSLKAVGLDPRERQSIEAKLTRVFEARSREPEIYDDSRKWNLGLKSELTSMSQAIDELMQENDETWEEFGDRLVHQWGLRQETLDLIYETWREYKTQDGKVRDAWENLKTVSQEKKEARIKAETDLARKVQREARREKGERVLSSAGMDTLVDIDTAEEYASTFPSTTNPADFRTAVGHFLGPSDYVKRVVGEVQDFSPIEMGVVAIGILSSAPRLKKWAGERFEALTRAVDKARLSKLARKK